MDFYIVRFWDSRVKDCSDHYVMTLNIERAKQRIEEEEPYVTVVEWKKISESELPDVSIIISK